MTRPPLTLRVTSGIVIVVCCAWLTSADSRGSARRDFFKPPSPCLTGPSCRHCVDTVQFLEHQVCCYHCRLDNLVILGMYCHCLDTILPNSNYDVGGNCSSGEVCDNCAVTISTDKAGEEETNPSNPGTHFCCQDCGLVVPHLYRDSKGCQCTGDSQGQKHTAVPRHDPNLQRAMARATTPPTTQHYLGNSVASAPASTWRHPAYLLVLSLPFFTFSWTLCLV